MEAVRPRAPLRPTKREVRESKAFSIEFVLEERRQGQAIDRRIHTYQRRHGPRLRVSWMSIPGPGRSRTGSGHAGHGKPRGY